MSPSHRELKALAPGYVLGILDADERRRFESHLKECLECAAEVRSLLTAVDALARSVPQWSPPPELRQRVVSAGSELSSPVGRGSAPVTPRARGLWLPVAATVLIALGAGIYGSHLHVERRLAALSERAEASDRDIAAARSAAVDVRSAMEVIAAPDLIRIDLQGQGAAASATARVWWSRQHGIVLAGTNIPAPPPGRCYQAWVISARAPVSLGILPEPGGGLAVFDTPPDIPQPLSVSVTLEPVGGAVAPTGAQILFGKVPGFV